jgi:hypothetical protein
MRMSSLNEHRSMYGRDHALDGCAVRGSSTSWRTSTTTFRAMAQAAVGVGVDTDAEAIERGRTNAAKRSLAERVTFAVEPATTASDPAEC